MDVKKVDKLLNPKLKMNKHRKADIVMKNLLKTRKECEKINEQIVLAHLVSFGVGNEGCRCQKS